MNTNSPLLHSVLGMTKKHFAGLQERVGVLYTQGYRESDKDFRIRVLTEVDKQGKIRLVEAYLN